MIIVNEQYSSYEISCTDMQDCNPIKEEKIDTDKDISQTIFIIRI